MNWSQLEEREDIALLMWYIGGILYTRGRSLKTLTGMFFKANRKKQYH